MSPSLFAAESWKHEDAWTFACDEVSRVWSVTKARSCESEDVSFLARGIGIVLLYVLEVMPPSALTMLYERRPRELAPALFLGSFDERREDGRLAFFADVAESNVVIEVAARAADMLARTEPEDWGVAAECLAARFLAVYSPITADEDLVPFFEIPDFAESSGHEVTMDDGEMPSPDPSIPLEEDFCPERPHLERDVGILVEAIWGEAAPVKGRPFIEEGARALVHSAMIAMQTVPLASIPAVARRRRDLVGLSRMLASEEALRVNTPGGVPLSPVMRMIWVARGGLFPSVAAFRRRAAEVPVEDWEAICTTAEIRVSRALRTLGPASLRLGPPPGQAMTPEERARLRIAIGEAEGVARLDPTGIRIVRNLASILPEDHADPGLPAEGPAIARRVALAAMLRVVDDEEDEPEGERWPAGLLAAARNALLGDMDASGWVEASIARLREGCVPAEVALGDLGWLDPTQLCHILLAAAGMLTDAEREAEAKDLVLGAEGAA